MANLISLDTILSGAFFFAGKWCPELKRNQSRDVLRLVLAKLYGASKGNPFYARVRASHASLAADLGLSREWTCKLIARLRATGWLSTVSLRLHDGTQEITLFRPGRTLKRLLLMLAGSRQRRGASPCGSSRVNTQSQKIPNKQEIEKNKAFLAQLRYSLTQKMANKIKEPLGFS